MVLDSPSILNFRKVSEECQGYKLDFPEAHICLQEMLNTCLCWEGYFMCANRRLRESSEERRWIAWGSYPLTSEHQAGALTLTFAFMRVLDRSTVRRVLSELEKQLTLLVIVIVIICDYDSYYCYIVIYCYLLLF
jgi:hypothetical protein